MNMKILRGENPICIWCNNFASIRKTPRILNNDVFITHLCDGCDGKYPKNRFIIHNEWILIRQNNFEFYQKISEDECIWKFNYYDETIMCVKELLLLPQIKKIFNQILKMKSYI